MNDPLLTEPVFASEAQETFTTGARVFDASGPAHERHLAREGVFIGTIDGAPVVEWDADGESTRVEFADFAGIRNLYR